MPSTLTPPPVTARAVIDALKSATLAERIELANVGSTWLVDPAVRQPGVNWRDYVDADSQTVIGHPDCAIGYVRARTLYAGLSLADINAERQGFAPLTQAQVHASVLACTAIGV